MIESIKIKIGETVLELSLEDAKNLKKELDELLNEKVIREYVPRWPYWGDSSGTPYRVTVSDGGASANKLYQMPF